MDEKERLPDTQPETAPPEAEPEQEEREGDFSARIEELEGEIARYAAETKKRDIADEFGLPTGAYKRIMGKTEDEWRADAKVLQKLFSAQRRRPAPIAVPEQAPDEDPIRAALRKLVSN